MSLHDGIPKHTLLYPSVGVSNDLLIPKQSQILSVVPNHKESCFVPSKYPYVKSNARQNLLLRSFQSLGGRCAFAPLRYAHPHLTRIMRKMARLAIFPNFLRYASATSHNPDVMSNSEFGLKVFYYRNRKIYFFPTGKPYLPLSSPIL